MRYRLPSFILGLLCSLRVASSASQELQARLQNSLKSARSLTNVEIQLLHTSIYPTSPKESDFSSTYQYTYIASGPKFRATCKLVSATHTNTTKLSEAAFNGTSYVTYSADTRLMTRQDKISGSGSSELIASPLIAPFLFLAKNADTCPGCPLRFSDIVSPDFAKGLILPKGQQSNGVLHIVMPGLPLGKKPTSWKIDIDETGDSFTPKAVTITIDAGMELAYTLLNYTNLGGYQFPTTVKCIASAYPPTSPPTVKSTETASVISARIPEDIPDSTFEIDEELAVVVWDAGQKRLTKMAPNIASNVSKWNLKRRVILAILLLTAITLPIMAFQGLSRKSG